MNAPHYAVYFMLDEPHGNKSTGGYSTAGAVSAPAAGRVIARIAPMLGLLPDIQDAAAISQSLAIPMQPAHGFALPHEAPWLGEPSAAAPPAAAPSPAPAAAPPVAATPHPAETAVPASAPQPRTREQMRHEAGAGTSVAAR